MGKNEAVIGHGYTITRDGEEDDIGYQFAQYGPERSEVSSTHGKLSSRSEQLSSFIDGFCSIGGYSDEEMTEFLLSAETTAGIVINIEDKTLSVQCLPSDSLCTLLSFRADIASAEAFLDIDKLHADLIKAGRFPSEASDYIRFVKEYSSGNPRDGDRTIFLNVFRTLENPRPFANAFSELAYHLRER